MIDNNDPQARHRSPPPRRAREQGQGVGPDRHQRAGAQQSPQIAAHRRALPLPTGADPAANAGRILARRERAHREAVFPDLRNLGILARALVIFVAIIAACTLATAPRPAELPVTFAVLLAGSLPVAAVVSVCWLLASPLLRRLAYWQAALLLGLCTLATTLAVARWSEVAAWRAVPLALAVVAVLLVYFDTLGRALSPAVTEARLQALQARIRPHFLFNAINGVLGVLRADPRRAEAALMDMAELFRVLMRENRNLQPLADEVALTRQYLDLEKLRLGDRLNVLWKLDRMPPDAMAPPLVLQPIAENAVYHGIEPTQAPGAIEIEIARVRSEVHLIVRNPFLEAAGRHHGGNKMAMGNIRERLALHFDAEARVTAGPRDGRYQVEIVIPYRPSAGGAVDTRTIV